MFSLPPSFASQNPPSRLPPRSVLLLCRGVHWTPAPSSEGGSTQTSFFIVHRLTSFEPRDYRVVFVIQKKMHEIFVHLLILSYTIASIENVRHFLLFRKPLTLLTISYNYTAVCKKRDYSLLSAKTSALPFLAFSIKSSTLQIGSSKHTPNNFFCIEAE